MRAFRTGLTLALLATGLAAQGEQDAKVDKDKDKAKPKVLEVGRKVPADLKLRDLDGETVEFGKLRGQVVFVHFWSTTCPWERLAEPKIAEIEQDYADRDVVVFAINANQNEIGAEPDDEAFEADDPKDLPYQGLRETLAEKELEFRVLVDHGNVVSNLLQARSTPHCFVIDAEGTLRYAGALDDDGRSEEAENPYVRQAIDALLAGEPVETQSSRPYG